MTADPIVADIHTAVSALVRWQLDQHGHADVLTRFMAEPWTVRREDGWYAVTLDLDGTLVARIAEDDVAWAIGVLQAKRDATRARMN